MEVKKGYKQTEVGITPEDWEVKNIGEQIDLLTGFPFSSSGYSQSGVKLLRGSNIKRGVTDWSPDITRYWEEVYPDLKQYLLCIGDIVIAMDGSLVGRSFARLTNDDLPALLLQRVARVRSKKIDMGYLKEFICSDYFTKHCDSVKTVTAIPHICPNDIKYFKIPLPPTLTEQTAIATALSDADALIQSLEKLIAKKNAIKQGAMYELLTGKKRLPGFSDKKEKYKQTEVGVIPGDWDVKKLEEIVDFLDGRRRPVKDSIRAKMRGEFPYYGASGIVDYVNDFLFDDDLILLGEDGENILSRNCRLAFRVRGRIWVNNHAHVLKAKPFIDTGFLVDLLESFNYEQYNTGTAQPKLNKQVCSNIPIPLPPTLTEQTAIANALSDMDTQIAGLETKLSKYKQIKQGMMQNLLTGRIRMV